MNRLPIVVIMLVACLLALASPALAEDEIEDCETPVLVHDNDGNLIMTYQMVFVGNEPYTECLDWNWEEKYINLFFKQTIENNGDHTITFLQKHVVSYRNRTVYCRDDEGNSYACGESNERTYTFDSETIALYDLQSNELEAGEISSAQRGSYFTSEEKHEESIGNRLTETYTIEYNGEEYEFRACRQYQ
ncbi:MAG: hypothetical protein D6E12_01495 [Desulfovibrio sp.]|nr:MAG: hypothetical protein D6E12_01495 [Desulfovibrio sp.]